MQSNLHQGVIVPIITPHDQADIFPLIDHLISGGVKTIFLLGTTGEARQIPYDTKIELITSVAKYVGNTMQVLVGISSENIPQSLELMKVAHESGAFASVISPLVVDNDAMLVVHSLLQQGPGDLVLYNFPAITNDLFIDSNDVMALMSEKRILGIKDSSGDSAYFQQLLKNRGNNKNFKIYSGPEHNLLETLKLNIDGFVPSTGNICPDLACRIWNEKEKGPWAEWNAIKEKIKNKNTNYILAIKEMLKEMELISNEKTWGTDE